MFRIDRSIKLQFYRFLRDISHRYRCAVDIRRCGSVSCNVLRLQGVSSNRALLVSSNYFFYSGWLRDDLKTNETVGRLENEMNSTCLVRGRVFCLFETRSENAEFQRDAS